MSADDSHASATSPALSTPRPTTDVSATAATGHEGTSIGTDNVAHEPISQIPTSKEENPMPAGPMRTDTTTAFAQAGSPPASPPAALPGTKTADSASAIGPSSDMLAPATKDEDVPGSILQITLLLTNGAKHPFKLDAKYLDKRKVDVQGGDPYNLSVYGLKELILREWREEWENKPTNPSNIRLIYMGRMLDDKAALKDQRLRTDDNNIMHMTIKPQDFLDEDDGGRAGKTSYTGHRDEPTGRSPGCRCIIM